MTPTNWPKPHVAPTAAARSWADLTPRQLGRFAEYHVTMALVRAGLDVYVPAIDDRGIDLIARLGIDRYLEIQVKAARGSNYVYLRKGVFPLHPGRYLAYVRFSGDSEPSIYLIPSKVWLAPNDLFVSRDYVGKRSAPEYGLQLTLAKLPRLQPYRLDRAIPALLSLEGSDNAER